MNKKVHDPIINHDFKNVYSPSDDTYLIIDYFKENINQDYFDGIKMEEIERILDMGTGTGIIALFFQLIKLVYQNFNAEIYASDILEEAIFCAKKNQIANNINNQIKFIRSDLFKSYSDSLNHSFNIIVFNPPYLPSSKIVNEHNTSSKIDYSWNGGKKGYELILDFLDDSKYFLNINQKGYIYFITSSATDLKSLDKMITQKGYINEIVSKKHVFFEDIFLNRIKMNCF